MEVDGFEELQAEPFLASGDGSGSPSRWIISAEGGVRSSGGLFRRPRSALLAADIPGAGESEPSGFVGQDIFHGVEGFNKAGGMIDEGFTEPAFAASSPARTGYWFIPALNL